MANFDIIMPKMGESIEEATITNWFVKEGDKVEEDDNLLEIATDKVDSEIPSPVEGIVKKILFKQDEVVAVGTIIAVIDMGGEASASVEEKTEDIEEISEPESVIEAPVAEISLEKVSSSAERFYSPLVRTIAREENITQSELDSIQGSGLNGRVQKKDVLLFLENRGGAKKPAPTEEVKTPAPAPVAASQAPVTQVGSDSGDEVIEMSRLRKLIASHMIKSKQISAHVTNMIEVDVTGVVTWRNRIKEKLSASDPDGS